MANEPATSVPHNGPALGSNPAELTAFLGDLLQVLHTQARQIERLTTHVEQHTQRLLAPSEMPLVVSELSALHARLQRGQEHPAAAGDRRSTPQELQGQRLPTQDMDDLC